MNKCSNVDHPHCTLWVLPGDPVCAAGHAQVAVTAVAAAAAAPGSFELVSAARATRSGAMATTTVATAAAVGMTLPTAARCYLHVSGFDPRAAGGRQAIKVELRGMAPGAAPLLSMRLRSALMAGGGATHKLERTTRGEWRPLFIEFSSRDKEHGQYQIDVELTSMSVNSGGNDGQPARRWVCTMLLLVPRADASLTDIHQTFLATHKNVRVVADDGSIAKLNGSSSGRLDIEVLARNASIAQLNLDAIGKVDLGCASIAWDEDLIEIDLPANAAPHPCPLTAACLVNAAPDCGDQRQLRLFALDECVLGRWEQYDPEGDVLLAHFGDAGQETGGLTRRLSGRHALLRRGERGFEIEDVSRYGILLDGVWPGKHAAVPLRLGMKIELTASIKGVVVLCVTALLPHAVILHRLDQGDCAESFYLMAPGRHPGFPLAASACAPRAAAMPLLFHRDGGFWHLDPASGVETALAPGAQLDRLGGCARHVRFAGEPYPESWIIRTAAGQLQQAMTGDLHTA
ncbi:FHA domain-containing protein [Massilia sp. PWRC2]|uniref:FHA domain-containing protein n=1 Tax=Massilia sp. PWRC2 TaxID=2804626 RepID=UPI003CF8FB9D